MPVRGLLWLGAAMVAGCGGAGSSASLAGSRSTPRATVSAVPSADPHYRVAVAEAQRLLGMAQVPPGAVALPPAAQRRVGLYFTPASPHLVDVGREWRVAQPLADVVAWIDAHPPHGLGTGASGHGEDGSGRVNDAGRSWRAPDTDAYIQAALVISMVPDGPNHTLVAADGTDTWLTTAPAPDTSGGPALRVSVDRGCPGSINGYRDVANPDRSLASRMLPAADPVGALICRYSWNTLSAASPPATAQPARVALDAAHARRLAHAINAIRLGWDGGGLSGCPTDLDVVEVIAFQYASGNDVDLWYYASGCEYLDNGYVVAYELANPSFYEGFMPVIAPR